MSTDARYRITGDITVKTKGKKVDISYGNKENTDLKTVAIIQTHQPLTSHKPYFLIEVHKCDPNAIIAIGIAPLDIDQHAGQYNNTVGYHSNTGRVYTSWKVHANTLGLPYGKGNTIGLYVTYFGEHQSTIIFFHEHSPVATRYHFEENRERYLPTITFSGGHVELSVIWPNAVEQLPIIDDMPISQWIRSPLCSYNSNSGIFENRSKLEDLPIQSPIPLSKSFRYFLVTQQEVSPIDGKGASVGLATCSPLKPTPTCSLMKDYYTWFAKMKMKVGSTIGWGVFYEENCEDDKAEQLCLVFVIFNKTIVDALFVLQPEGGFVPIVLLQPFATKVFIERRDILTNDELSKLQGFHTQMLGPAVEIYRKDREERALSEEDFRRSEQVLLDINDHSCRISIPKTENTIHYIQFCQPLTYERSFFFVELEKISKQCQVIVGIASSKHQLNEAPGIDHDTVGYNSYTGKLYSNRKDIGNMRGHKCKKGETMGVQLEIFDKDMSVVLFTKNFRPVGTRYLTLKDHSQYFPTILIESNGDPAELIVHWQTRISVPPLFNVKNPEDWCLPANTVIDLKEKLFTLPEHLDYALCIQAPCSLNRKYNHFEIILLDKFSDSEPPPAISLCTASPLDPTPTSQFKQDYLRFWPTGDAAKHLKQGDKIGWGIIFPQEEDKEQLIICYLTVNRTVGYVRVLYQPVGGLYPVIIAPPNVNRIQMEFSAARISTEDFTAEQIKTILADARLQIAEEEQLLNPSTESMEIQNNDTAQPLNEYPYDNYPIDYYNYPSEEEHQFIPPPPVKSSACTIL